MHCTTCCRREGLKRSDLERLLFYGLLLLFYSAISSNWFLPLVDLQWEQRVVMKHADTWKNWTGAKKNVFSFLRNETHAQQSVLKCVDNPTWCKESPNFTCTPIEERLVLITCLLIIELVHVFCQHESCRYWGATVALFVFPEWSLSLSANILGEKCIFKMCYCIVIKWEKHSERANLHWAAHFPILCLTLGSNTRKHGCFMIKATGPLIWASSIPRISKICLIYSSSRRCH